MSNIRYLCVNLIRIEENICTLCVKFFFCSQLNMLYLLYNYHLSLVKIIDKHLERYLVCSQIFHTWNLLILVI